MKLPVYEALIDDICDGIANISLVDLPAVEVDFVAFRKDRAPMLFSVENEEQRMILGVVMRADMLIYRYDDVRGEYYIRYSKETIKKMAQKLFSDGRQNSVNVMHIDGSNVDGVNMVQMFIKDEANGISPKGFEDIEDGSLFAQYKVENDEVWEDIKNGTFKGFSIEGYFNIREAMSKQNKTLHMSKLKERLKRLLMAFGSVDTNNGEIFYEDELEVGTEVFDQEDNPCADGEYETEDKVIVVADGKVTEIRDKETEDKPEDTAEEPEPEIEAEEATGETETNEDKSEPEQGNGEIEALKADLEAAKAGLEAAKADIEALKGEIEALKETIAAIANQPAAKPVTEEFEQTTKDISTGNKKLDRLSRLMSAK